MRKINLRLQKKDNEMLARFSALTRRSKSNAASHLFTQRLRKEHAKIKGA